MWRKCSSWDLKLATGSDFFWSQKRPCDVFSLGSLPYLKDRIFILQLLISTNNVIMKWIKNRLQGLSRRAEQPWQPPLSQVTQVIAASQHLPSSDSILSLGFGSKKYFLFIGPTSDHSFELKGNRNIAWIYLVMPFVITKQKAGKYKDSWSEKTICAQFQSKQLLPFWKIMKRLLFPG